MSDTVACPGCTRLNAVHRMTCLYCGAQMPNPSPRSRPSASTALPSNLDALVREALAGGDIRKLKSAMAETRREAPAPLPPPPSLRSPPPAPRPPPQKKSVKPAAPSRSAEPAEVPGTPPLAEDPLGDAIRTVIASARAALAAHNGGRPVHEALASVQGAIEHARALAPEPVSAPEPLMGMNGPEDGEPLLIPIPDEAPIPVPVPVARDRPAVELPRYSHHWLLVIQGPGNAELARPIAAVLGVDVVTARFSAVARTPRVVMRGDDPTPLRSAAVGFQRLGVDAVVIARQELLSIASPDVVLGSNAGGRFQVSATWPWTGEPPATLPSDVRSLPWMGMKLAVPGEVVVKRYRLGRSLARGRRKEKILRLGAERRTLVVDLHGPGRFLRLVAGQADTSGLPGHDPRSAIQAHKGLLESLPQLIRGCRMTGNRTCAPNGTPHLPEGYDGAHPIELSGWALWEEHTRFCRLLAGLSSADVPVERA